MQMCSQRNIRSASTLAGYRVRNAENEDLGTIEELMIDATSGQVKFAVLCFIGSLHASDKLFAIPWNFLQLRADDRAFVLNVSSQMLENAPGFDPNHWPDFSDETWGTEVCSFYAPNLAPVQH